MTEIGGSGVTSTAGHDYLDWMRCIGAPLKGVQWRIVDDAGRELPTGQCGELWVCADGQVPRRGFFSGCPGDEEETEKAWAEGWFHTGDIVSADESGLFYFVDRNKSIIRRSGESISGLEVEAILTTE